MKDFPASFYPPVSPSREGEPLLPAPKPPSIPLPKAEVGAAAKILPFASLDSHDLAAENKRLCDELARCHVALEKWAKTEKEWSRQRLLFRAMYENISDLMVVLDTLGRRTWNNPAYAHLLGYEGEEIIGTNALTEVHPDDRAAAAAALQKTMTEKSPQQVGFRMKSKRGAWLEIQAEALPILSSGNDVDGVLLLGHDVTEINALGAQLRDAQTTTAPEMTESTARAFDQILTNVFGNLAIVRNLNGPNNAIAARLGDIERALKRAHDLTAQMLMASTSDSPKEKVALEPVIQEATSAILRGTMIRAEYIFPRHLPEIETDPEALSHAIRNVVVNSTQAMDKGVIRIAAEIISPEQFAARTDLPLQSGSYVGIHIQDQGHGMAERIAARAFEPYFTTRPESQGLGLTTALSAVKRQGGTILLDSTPGVGTSVSIYIPAPSTLPRDQAPVATPVPASSPRATGRIPVLTATSKPEPRTARRILLMDDEQMILDIVSQMLRHLGYEVMTCTDGSQAIAAFAKARSQREPFDVAIMDLLIPNGIGGQDAVHTIRKIHPEAKVIASSGQLDHPAMLDFKKYGFIGVLEKPYKVDKLHQVIDSAINTAGVAAAE